jgi:N-methylhydantoinase A
MSVRVIARGTAASALVPERLAFAPERERGMRSRRVYFGPEFGAVDTPVCGRGDLADAWRDGPLLVEEFDSTSVVPPDGRVRRIAWDTIEIALGSETS